VTVSLELWHLITLLIMFLGASAGAAKLLLSQMQRHLDLRFSAQDAFARQNHQALAGRLDALEESRRAEAEQWRRVERELLELKAELPTRFVQREDYIRGQSVLEVKLDALAVRVENLQLRGAARGETR
jgi:hypothetical protein